MKEMLRDHKKDVAEFRKASQNAKDPDVKAWAAKTLPTLEEHLNMAQDIDKQVSAGKGRCTGVGAQVLRGMPIAVCG